MKRVLAIFLAMCMVLALAACGQQGDKDKDKDNKTTTTGSSESTGTTSATGTTTTTEASTSATGSTTQTTENPTTTPGKTSTTTTTTTTTATTTTTTTKTDDEIDDFEDFINAEDLRSDATWLADAKYGISVSFSHPRMNSNAVSTWTSQGKKTTWNEAANDFDAEEFADQVVETGAAYVVWFTQQKDRYFNAPNATYDSLIGYKPGQACSERDMIMDVGKALKERGIKLMLYVTADGPWGDVIAFSKLCEKTWYTPTTQAYTWTDAFKKNWCAVLKEYSQRYGDLVSGWWIDGADGMKYDNDQELLRLAKAVKSGNPDAIVTMNAGGATLAPRFYSSADDFTAGEADSFEFYPESQFITGNNGEKVQWHVLSYLGGNETKAKYTAQEMVDYVQKVTAKKGCVTLDCWINRYGEIAPSHLEIMREVKKAVR